MNKNSRVNQFETAPMMSEQITRTKMTITNTHKTSFSMGSWYPIYIDTDVLPNHTKQIDIDYVIRATTFKAPVMDDLFIDFIATFTPNRLVFDNWAELLGENKDTEWVQETEYVVPKMDYSETVNGVELGSVGDYFGLPLGYKGKVSALPFRAYRLTWTEWCRNQNVRAPEFPNTTAADDSATEPLYNKILEAYKLPDYFTSALPEPQKGGAVMLPIGESAPVTATIDGTVIQPTTITGQLSPTDNMTMILKASSGDATKKFIMGDDIADPSSPFYTTLKVDGTATGTADLRNAIAATVNAQRMAFQIQGILEMDARGGTRYVEIVRNQFKINMPSAQWRPEYLGGGRRPINIQQVIQNSETATTPLGTVAAFSQSSGRISIPTKTFCEHGIYMILCTVRQRHSYQQGVDKSMLRFKRYDFFTPPLAHLGEQPIYTEEIFATGEEENDKTVFGFAEAWTTGYRVKKNHITGMLRSTHTAPLDIWHFGDKYEDAPVLSNEFCRETAQFVDRTLQISSEVVDQFIMDTLFTDNCVIPLPAYSIPGLIDHF